LLLVAVGVVAVAVHDGRLGLRTGLANDHRPDDATHSGKILFKTLAVLTVTPNSQRDLDPV